MDQDRNKYSLYSFSDKEIARLVELISDMASLSPIDRRTITPKIEKYGVSTGLFVWKCRHGSADFYRDNQFPWFDDICEKCGERRNWRLYYADYTNGNPNIDLVHETPPEVLWRLVRPMLGEPGHEPGHSIVNSNGWDRLNIWPQDHWLPEKHPDIDCQVHQKWAADSMRRKKEVLQRLDQWGYIDFKSVGDIWQIRILG